MHAVDEIWRGDHLKERHEADISKNESIINESKKFKDIGTDFNFKDENMYDAPDSEDSLANISDEILQQKYGHSRSGDIIDTPFSSPEVSHR